MIDFGRGHPRGAPFCEANDTVVSDYICSGFSVLALADIGGMPWVPLHTDQIS